MPSEKIGEHDIEYEGVEIPGTEQWAAYLAVFGPSTNPMHRNSVFPHQHVATEEVFTSKEAAEAAALAFAKTLLSTKSA